MAKEKRAGVGINIDIASYGIPGTAADTESILELGGMRYGGADQISYATGRPKKPIPAVNLSGDGSKRKK